MFKFLGLFKKTLAVLFFFSFAVFLISHSMLSNVPLGGNDERTYTKYVQVFHEEGISGIQNLIKGLPQENPGDVAPSPFRILFVSVGALSCTFLDSCGLQNLALISFISGMGVVVTSFLLFRKWFSTKTAFLSTLLLVISPLLLSLSNRALQDPFFALIVIASILFYHLVWTRDRKADLYIFGLLLLAGFLTKETFILLYFSFLVVGLYYYFQDTPQSSLQKIKKISIPIIVVSIIYFIIVCLIAGGVKEFFDYYILWSERAMNLPYVINYQQGAWFRYIVDFILVSPLVFLLAIIGVVIPLSSREDSSGRAISTLYFLSGLAIFSVQSVYSIRFVLFLDVFIRALAVIGAVGILEKINNIKYRHIATSLLIICIVIIEVSQFYRLYVITQIYDPVTSLLIFANGFAR